MDRNEMAINFAIALIESGWPVEQIAETAYMIAGDMEKQQ